MKHSIDLKKYPLRSDLAIDNIDCNNKLKGVESSVEEINHIKVTDIKLSKDNDLMRKSGLYITIEFEDITDMDNYKQVGEVLLSSMDKIFKCLNINEQATCLVVGLGNKYSTPDSLGPKVVDNIIVTNHIYELGQLEEGFRVVSAIAPGVTGQTGIETLDIIKSLVNKIKPDFVIAIDSLASQSIDRVNKTIQMTDTGIHPGSGIGNSRKEISKESIGVDVIAIGVPTVVDAAVIVADTINYMYKHYAFIKNYSKKPQSKLTFNNINYLNKDIVFNKDEKEQLLGLVGKLNFNETKQLISEVLTPIGYNMMVTPKEIDFVMDKLSDLISSNLNKQLHRIIKNRD